MTINLNWFDLNQLFEYLTTTIIRSQDAETDEELQEIAEAYRDEWFLKEEIWNLLDKNSNDKEKLISLEIKNSLLIKITNHMDNLLKLMSGDQSVIPSLNYLNEEVDHIDWEEESGMFDEFLANGLTPLLEQLKKAISKINK
ncbi:hypothetical protein [[Mycoplasma] testudinis]|uniref:hypothetical protein n=1 Tax=[Mycoplasma] testudinis TaxID=33924 RepID=UPI000481E102|nr:hypothetical protein [[Mycoplasma] testudinis]